MRRKGNHAVTVQDHLHRIQHSEFYDSQYPGIEIYKEKLPICFLQFLPLFRDKYPELVMKRLGIKNIHLRWLDSSTLVLIQFLLSNC